MHDLVISHVHKDDMPVKVSASNCASVLAVLLLRRVFVWVVLFSEVSFSLVENGFSFTKKKPFDKMAESFSEDQLEEFAKVFREYDSGNGMPATKISCVSGSSPPPNTVFVFFDNCFWFP